MLAVETINVSRTFTKKKKIKTALSNINLKIEHGSFYGLLGPNGAGKTTLIKILSTLLLPSNGSAKVLGFDVKNETNEIRWRMSLVSGGEFSGYGLLTVEEQLWMFALFNGMSSLNARNKIDELLDIVGLEDARKIELSQLSTGMRQKMNLVRGIMTDPEILFLDEPTLGLDVEIARDVRNYLKKWIIEGPDKRTVLLTTHYMQEADELCEKIGIINDGQLILEGTSDGIKKSSSYICKYSINPVSASSFLNSYKRYAPVLVTENKFEILVNNIEEEEIIYTKLRFDKNVTYFDKILPTLEDAFMSLTGRELN